MKVYESLAFAHAARCGRVLFRKEEVQILETAIRDDEAKIQRLESVVQQAQEKIDFLRQFEPELVRLRELKHFALRMMNSVQDYRQVLSEGPDGTVCLEWRTYTDWNTRLCQSRKIVDETLDDLIKALKEPK